MEDPESNFTIDSVQGISFQKSDQTNPSFGFTKSSYWLKFTLFNSEANTREKMIEVTFPLIDEIVFYTPSSEGYKGITVGITKPFKERPIESHTFVFPIQVPPGESNYFFRFKNEDSMQMPLILWEPTAFYNNIIDI